MNNKQFNIKYIPEISNNIEETVSKTLNEIIINYILLINDSVKTIVLSIENNIIKPLTIYNLFFLVEIYIKCYLAKHSKLSIREIEDKGHDIIGLIAIANKVDEKINFNKIKFLLQQFRNKNNGKLDIQKYYDFKYNHSKYKETLIFDYKINDTEMNNMEEVIEWIKCHMWIL